MGGALPDDYWVMASSRPARQRAHCVGRDAEQIDASAHYSFIPTFRDGTMVLKA